MRALPKTFVIVMLAAYAIWSVTTVRGLSQSSVNEVGNTPPHEQVVLLDLQEERQATDLGVYLRTRGASSRSEKGGMLRLADSPTTRQFLADFLRLCLTRVDVAAHNVANMNTTRNAAGEVMPFERQVVTVDEDGRAEIEPDGSSPRLMYEPGHPDAAASGRNAGYVAYPNISVALERAEAMDAVSQYEAAAIILRRFEPTLILSIDPRTHMKCQFAGLAVD